MRQFHNQGWGAAPSLHIVLADHFALRPAEPPAFAQKHIALHCIARGFWPPGVRRLLPSPALSVRVCLDPAGSLSAIAHLTWEQLVGRGLSMADPLLDQCSVVGSPLGETRIGGLQND